MKAASSPSTEPNFYSMPCCEVVGDVADEVTVDTEDESIEGGYPFTREIITSLPQTIVSSDRSSPERTPPGLVSPESSPVPVLSLKARRVSVDYTSYSLLMPPSLKREHGDFFPALMPSSSSSNSEDDDDDLTLPSAGDPVFFEGHMFRYLDQLDQVQLDLEQALQAFDDPFDDLALVSSSI